MPWFVNAQDAGTPQLCDLLSKDYYRQIGGYAVEYFKYDPFFNDSTILSGRVYYSKDSSGLLELLLIEMEGGQNYISDGIKVYIDTDSLELKFVDSLMSNDTFKKYVFPPMYSAGLQNVCDSVICDVSLDNLESSIIYTSICDVRFGIKVPLKFEYSKELGYITNYSKTLTSGGFTSEESWSVTPMAEAEVSVHIDKITRRFK